MYELEELEHSPQHWVGSFGPVIVVIWLAAVDPTVCRTLPQIATRVCQKHRCEKAVVLSIALPHVSAPSSEARKAVANLLRDSSARISRVAVLREGQGFVASAVASIVVGIQMLAGASSPNKFFTNLRDALDWVASDLGALRWSTRHAALARERITSRLDEFPRTSGAA